MPHRVLIPLGGGGYGPEQTLTLQPDAATGQDDSVNSGVSTANYGIRTNLVAATTYKGLLKFDLSAIPSTAKCVSATLSLYQMATGAAQAFTITISSIAAGNAAWIEGTRNGTQALAGQPCWDALAADGAGGVTTPWAGSAGLSTADTDYETPALATFSGNRSDADGTEYSVALPTTRVRGWFGATNTNYGLLITTNVAPGGLASSDHATAGYRPKLVVVYRAK